jgi:hypothetical protein
LLLVPGSDPVKYAVALMGELFTDEEMGRSCYVGTRTKKPCLPLNKRELLEGAPSLPPPPLSHFLSVFSVRNRTLLLFPVLIPRVH